MNVLFICSGGMSSAIAVDALKKEAEKNGQELHVKAIGSSEVEDEIKNGWNVCMVAPQIRHQFKKIEGIAQTENIPCGQIPPNAYNPMGGKRMLETMNNTVDQ
ncbi:PTS sugar transporter subunit IIB [Marinococcus sp. PL1-022]|uniref:PTS sugar transporter subunit IIB n=1 Tax=Marinococcus sp. PL1-022 TaxID=3095363 RepID=UPI0026356716|nr:PTS sugar transporter subunit IIB [Marinococcus sp. PL1-022]MDX6153167.1 PTS sugar transporter subunit IIB [Marinococcus sp. PL1-022]